MRRLIGFVALATAAFVGPLAQPATADTISDEAAFVNHINQLRASKGLNALIVDGNLTDIARGFSQEMANAGSIWHNPNFRNLVTANWARLGENVGMGPEVTSLFNAFVNSPGHYANLVDPAFTHVGVGVVYGGRQIFTAHQFMTVKGASAPRPATPRTTVTTRPPAPRPVVTTPVTRPTTTTTTTIAPPPPSPPPPPPPVVPERIRLALETLRRFDPAKS